jgi:hypothetical protein
MSDRVLFILAAVLAVAIIVIIALFYRDINVV